MSKIYNKVLNHNGGYYFLLHKTKNKYHCLGLKVNYDEHNPKQIYDEGCSKLLLILESEYIHVLDSKFITKSFVFHNNNDIFRFIIWNRTNLKIKHPYVINKIDERRHMLNREYAQLEYDDGKISNELFLKRSQTIEQFCLNAF